MNALARGQYWMYFSFVFTLFFEAVSHWASLIRLDCPAIKSQVPHLLLPTVRITNVDRCTPMLCSWGEAQSSCSCSKHLKHRAASSALWKASLTENKELGGVGGGGRGSARERTGVRSQDPPKSQMSNMNTWNPSAATEMAGSYKRVPGACR